MIQHIVKRSELTREVINGAYSNDLNTVKDLREGRSSKQDRRRERALLQDKTTI